MKQSMTLLQRAVIDRLHKAGRHDLAEMARDAWPRGAQIAVFGEIRSEELRADVDRANEQAIASRT